MAVQRLGIGDNVWATLLNAMKEKGNNNDPMPSSRCHWRASIDETMYIFEAEFHDHTIDEDWFVNWAAGVFGIDPADVTTTTGYNKHGRFSTFALGGENRIRVGVFGFVQGEGWPTRQESNRAVKRYIYEHADEWDEVVWTRDSMNVAFLAYTDPDIIAYFNSMARRHDMLMFPRHLLQSNPPAQRALMQQVNGGIVLQQFPSWQMAEDLAGEVAHGAGGLFYDLETWTHSQGNDDDIPGSADIFRGICDQHSLGFNGFLSYQLGRNETNTKDMASRCDLYTCQALQMQQQDPDALIQYYQHAQGWAREVTNIKVWLGLSLIPDLADILYIIDNARPESIGLFNQQDDLNKIQDVVGALR